jgi:hypothetical protein
MLHTFKAWMATLTSLWIAVLACFMGCMLPILVERHHSGPMANMERCCHSGGNSPAKPTDGKSTPSRRMSCCPVEVTVPTKWDGATIGIAPSQHFALASTLDSATAWFHYSVEFVPSAWHCGRDTLLETHLLRI